MLHVLFALSLGLQSDPPVTLTVQACAASKAVKALGLAAHRSFLASAETASDTLALQLTAVPLSEAMRRIAEVDSAEWKQEGAAYRLVRPARLVRQVRERQLQSDVAALKKAISKASAGSNSKGPWSQESADALASHVEQLTKEAPPERNRTRSSSWSIARSNLAAQTPINRALDKIIRGADPEALARMPLSPRTVRIVWSTHPTAMQMQMPVEVQSIVDEYRSDQALWDAALKPRHIVPPLGMSSNAWEGLFGFARSGSEGPVDTVLLSVDSKYASAYYMFTLQAFDASGHLLALGSKNLVPDSDVDLAAFKKLVPSTGDPPIRLEGESQQVFDLVHLNPSETRTRASASLLPRLTDAVRFEPLAWIVSPELVEIAKGKNANLVACLPDSLGLRAYDLFTASAKMSEARLALYLRSIQCSFDLRDGWLTIEPSRPADEWAWRADRTALRAFLQRASHQRPISIDEQAALLPPLPDRGGGDLWDSLFSIVNGRRQTLADSPTLRIYASLTAEQRAQALGDGLRVQDLPPAASDLLFRMVFGESQTLRPVPGLLPAQTDLNLYREGLLSEPTEALPTGFPRESLLLLSQKESTAVFLPASGDVGDGHGRAVYAGVLARQAFMRDHPALYPGAGEQTSASKEFMCGQKTKLTLSFVFPPGLSIATSLEDDFVTDLKPATFDELPDDFRREYETTYAAMAKVFRVDQGQGKIPPP